MRVYALVCVYVYLDVRTIIDSNLSGNACIVHMHVCMSTCAHMCVCMCVCERARARERKIHARTEKGERVCARVCVRVRVCVCMCARAWACV